MKVLANVCTLTLLGAIAIGTTACKEDEPDPYGVIRIRLEKATGTDDPFIGTVSVTVQLDYDECLQEFYTISNTDQAQDAPGGDAVFSEWQGRLCDSSEYSRTIACEVAEFRQTLIDSTDTFNLRVEYNVLDDTALSLREIAYGPLPTDDTAGCVAQVVLQQSSVFGKDNNGQIIWSIDSFDANNKARTGQSAPLQVSITRN